MERESLKKISEIEDATNLARAKGKADSDYYSAVKASEANKLKLSKEFLELERYRSLTNNLKIYYGPNIPGIFFPNIAEELQKHSKGPIKVNVPSFDNNADKNPSN
ncbi:erlin-1-like [Paramuricea clavata]|uniref:Erlin-1-like n=1 Tax=Paramuricea clavata TaxID=317549 RepID=A0A7D9LF29_PARCT|nr:erlin-1-like [Paramuricea clavata]